MSLPVTGFWLMVVALWLSGLIFGLGLWLAYQDGFNGIPRWRSQLVLMVSLLVGLCGIIGSMPFWEKL